MVVEAAGEIRRMEVAAAAAAAGGSIVPGGEGAEGGEGEGEERPLLLDSHYQNQNQNRNQDRNNGKARDTGSGCCAEACCERGQDIYWSDGGIGYGNLGHHH